MGCQLKTSTAFQNTPSNDLSTVPRMRFLLLPGSRELNFWKATMVTVVPGRFCDFVSEVKVNMEIL